MIYAQKCPVCNGTGWVSVPPGVAGDAEYFSTTNCGPYPCRCCSNGILYISQRENDYDYGEFEYCYDVEPHNSSGSWMT